MNRNQQKTLSLAALLFLGIITGLAARQVSVRQKSTIGSLATLMFQSGGTLYTGLGLKGDGTSSTPVEVDTAVVPTRLSAAATLTWGGIAQNTCWESNITLTGATVGDEVMLGPPATVDRGFQWSGYVSAASTVTVRMCKITSGTMTPVSGTWRATIVRSF
jgi:hypothetical protein